MKFIEYSFTRSNLSYNIIPSEYSINQIPSIPQFVTKIIFSEKKNSDIFLKYSPY